LSTKKALRHLYYWIAPVIDPLKTIKGIAGYLRYFRDWYLYSRLPGAEPIRFMDAWPQVHDRTGTAPLDAHYFYVNGWAMRCVLTNRPLRHVDIASQTIFANLLGAIVPVIFFDYRPLKAYLHGFDSVGASILDLPLADNSMASVSCLHVAEHIGLGRYGDALNPQGTHLAAQELSRILAPGGNLYFAVPVGRGRLCFNGCRVHPAEVICQYFPDLELVEFSGVHDDGRYVENVQLSEFKDSEYACGMFWFRKSQKIILPGNHETC
jgi:SAM-dependent methyltransferase